MGQLSAKLRNVAYGDRPAIAWWCPGCEKMHQVTIDAPRGWAFDGNATAPTISPSVLVNGPPGGPPSWQRCHCFIRAGRVEFLADCTHALRGQTVELPNLPPHLRDATACDS